jgi:hypothetical protein
MQKKLAIGFVKALAFIVLPLFLAAGTLAWPAGWIFVISFMAMTGAISFMLLHHDPALLNERLKGLYQDGQPRWDKLLLSAVMLLWLAWLMLIGLDAGRFHWSDVPLAVQVLGFAGVVAALIALYVVSRTNSFLVPVVRLQSERAIPCMRPRCFCSSRRRRCSAHGGAFWVRWRSRACLCCARFLKIAPCSAACPATPIMRGR